MKESFVSDKSGRLDVILAEKLSLTRSKAQKIIETGVTVRGKEAYKAGFQVEEGDEIIYEPLEEKSQAFEPKDIPLDIVYEDKSIMVINKPRGLVVHPAAGHANDTLANGLAFIMQDDDKEENEDFRMGIVHRIDKDTSGLLVVAKTPAARDYLVSQISTHLVKREYLCLAYGMFKDKYFVVKAPIGRDKYNRKKMAVDVENGKDAVTHFEVIKQFHDVALLKCVLETGRTHQIRVHLNYIQHPIVGDNVYTNRKSEYATKGQVLHAYKLVLSHPDTKKEMEFYAPVDDYFKRNIVYFATGK